MLQQVPKPPQDEILQLEKMQEARRLLQAQALGQQKKVWLTLLSRIILVSFHHDAVNFKRVGQIATSQTSLHFLSAEG